MTALLMRMSTRLNSWRDTGQHRLKLVLLPQVRKKRQSPAPKPAHLLSDSLDLLPVGAGMDHKVGALIGQGECGGPADVPTGAGDQGYPFQQRHLSPRSLRVPQQSFCSGLGRARPRVLGDFNGCGLTGGAPTVQEVATRVDHRVLLHLRGRPT